MYVVSKIIITTKYLSTQISKLINIVYTIILWSFIDIFWMQMRLLKFATFFIQPGIVHTSTRNIYLHLSVFGFIFLCILVTWSPIHIYVLIFSFANEILILAIYLKKDIQIVPLPGCPWLAYPLFRRPVGYTIL